MKDQYRVNTISDTLAFIYDVITWTTFHFLMKDLYHNEIERDGR